MGREVFDRSVHIEGHHTHPIDITRALKNDYSSDRKKRTCSSKPKRTSPCSSAAAAAHHRLLWIHRFADGNGRVARLMSHASLLEAVLFRGGLPRGDVAALLGMSDRGSRRIVSALLERGVLASESTRASLSITFPAALAARWMPGLFPESTEHA